MKRIWQKDEVAERIVEVMLEHGREIIFAPQGENRVQKLAEAIADEVFMEFQANLLYHFETASSSYEARKN